MGADYSSLLTEQFKVPDDICGFLLCPWKFYLINVPSNIENQLLQEFQNIIGGKNEIKQYNSVLHRLKTDKTIFCQGSGEDKSAKIRLLFCKYQAIFCKEGWTLVNSPDLSYRFSISSWIFYKDINPVMMTIGSTDNEFCSIGLSSYDGLHFINVPEFLVQSLKSKIDEVYVKGSEAIKNLECLENCWKLKLNGLPWSSSGESSLEAREAVLCIIQSMSRFNWRLVNSTALKPDACDTMFFRKYNQSFELQNIGDNGISEQFFILALMPTNWMSILGTSNTFLRDQIAASIQRHEVKGIKETTEKKHRPAVELISDIWSRRKEKELKTRRTMALLFQDMAAIGWMPLESIDCSRSRSDLSSIAFVRIPPCRMAYFSLMPQRAYGSKSSLFLLNAPPDVIELVYKVFKATYPVENEKCVLNTTAEYACISFAGVYALESWERNCRLFFTQAILAVISELKKIEWYLTLSADTSMETKSEGSGNNRKTIRYSIYGMWFAKFIPS